jgi:hypothetical protein
VLSAAINHARYKWEWEIANPLERMSLKEFAHKSGERVKYMQNGYQAACVRAGSRIFGSMTCATHSLHGWLAKVFRWQKCVTCPAIRPSK